MNDHPDLEHLVASIAQDLKSPLDSLSKFARMFSQQYQSSLDDQGQQYLEAIFQTTSKIQTKIQNLEAYSNAGKGEKTWVLVDLNQTCQQVIEQFETQIAKTQAEILVGELPKMIVDPTEIAWVFQQLLENALKFASERSPKIVITATPKTEAWLLTISDNGIGIAPQFQLQIFHPGYRINSSPANPGLGMGLAICQKIIERYGGKIEVDSVLGKGSTFYLTLPMDICPQSLVNQAG